MEEDHQTAMVPQEEEEGHPDLGITPVERMAIPLVLEDIKVVLSEDLQEEVPPEEGPATLLIQRKRRERENGS